ncbi:MAG TPA: DUF3553 domain-containing protein, partial [Kofleriaceae bacterium]|nr:DUF3553 domain-containing protein [Kofleriaceae bacterium]
MLKEGDRVRHRTHTDWGTGTVLKQTADYVVLEFPAPMGEVQVCGEVAANVLLVVEDPQRASERPSATALTPRCRHCQAPLRSAQHSPDRLWHAKELHRLIHEVR